MSIGSVMAAEVVRRRAEGGIVLATFILFFAFSLISPFLPLYIAELGVQDTRQVLLWSGLCLGVSRLVEAMAAPVWGVLGDRWSYRLMASRALLGLSFMLMLTGMVGNVGQLFVVRVISGLVGGFTPAAAAFVSSRLPPARVGPTLGMLQSVQMAGIGVGPVIGGFLIAALSIRQSFFIASALVLIAFILFIRLSPEPQRRDFVKIVHRAPPLRLVLTMPSLMLMAGIVAANEFNRSSLEPLVPVLVGRLGTGWLPSPALIGLITTAGALAAALSATLVGRLAGRWRLRSLLLVGLVVGGGSSLSILLASSHLQLLAATTLLGLMIGIVTTTALLASAQLLPEGIRGIGFGLVASGGLLGRAISWTLSSPARQGV